MKTLQTILMTTNIQSELVLQMLNTNHNYDNQNPIRTGFAKLNTTHKMIQSEQVLQMLNIIYKISNIQSEQVLHMLMVTRIDTTLE